ncbi:biotin/lipoyl-binding protein [Brenneria salicis ATCC 15712 = DSM 30166]|uniref:Biotin/lipoyl-binding protein n=1 Tax=Brenneria salicis ATCC 15712 = DSM 30166 TaxID=714314 RepID=A0A366I1K6_9GAMM|nr:biotin/lipoyl-binding protein [Brenneria salicis ATCC 15712 = DSM 30166]
MNKKKLVSAGLIIILIAAAVYGFVHYRQQQNKPLTLYGNVDIRTVNLGFRVGGRLMALDVDEGDSIRPGQKLATLDNAPYQNALHQGRPMSPARRLSLGCYRKDTDAKR